MRLETYGIGGCIPQCRNRLSPTLLRSSALVSADFGRNMAYLRKGWLPPVTFIGRHLAKFSAYADLSLHKILRIARTLGVNADELMHGLQEFDGD